MFVSQTIRYIKTNATAIVIYLILKFVKYRLAYCVPISLNSNICTAKSKAIPIRTIIAKTTAPKINLPLIFVFSLIRSNIDIFDLHLFFYFFAYHVCLPSPQGEAMVGEYNSSTHLYHTNASTKSFALNSCKSSTDSPTPMNLIGILNSFAIANTIPPFAVPSSFVNTIPVTPVASIKVFA